MENEENNQKNQNKIYLKIATDLINHKEFESHDLMKILNDDRIIEEFRKLTKNIVDFSEFNHDKISLTSIPDKNGLAPAIKIPFKTPIDSKKNNELRESIDWFYDNLKEKSGSEILLNDKELIFIFNGNPESQASKYSKILSFAKTRSLYLSGKSQIT